MKEITTLNSSEKQHYIKTKVLILILSLWGNLLNAQTVPVTFHLDANNTQYQTVQLWNGNSLLDYTNEDNDRIFELTLDLSPDYFGYHVLRDNSWGWDPHNPNYADGYPSNGAFMNISDPMVSYLLPKDGDMMRENRIQANFAYTPDNPPIESTIEVLINGISIENASQYFDSNKRQLTINDPSNLVNGTNTVSVSYQTNKGTISRTSTFIYKPIKLMTDTMVYRMDHILSWGRVFSKPYPASVFLECNGAVYETPVNEEGYFGADIDIQDGDNEVNVAYTEQDLSNPVDTETIKAEIRRYWWVELDGKITGTTATIQSLVHDIDMDELTFEWSLNENSPSSLNISGSTSEISFNIPEEEGEFLIDLKATSVSGHIYLARKLLVTKSTPHFIEVNERAPWMEKMVLYEVESDFFDGQFKFERMSQTFQHMKNLGINAFRITPFVMGGFISWDHFKIFPPNGTIDDLRAMTDLAHEYGLKVLFDIPLSHTSAFHPFILSNFLLKELAEPYYNFSMWQGKPGESDIVYSPDNGRQCVYTNLDNSYTQEYFTRLMEYWVEVAGADGFRIDCGQESFLRAPDYIKYLHKRLRNINPNLFILEEGDFRDHPNVNYFDFGDAAYDWGLNTQWGGGTGGFPGMFQGTYTVDQLHELLMTNIPDSALVLRYANSGYFDFLSELYGKEQERSCVAVVTTTYGLPNIRAGEEVGLARNNFMYDLTDPDSVMPFYERLIKMRKGKLGNYPVIERYTENIPDYIYAYTSKSNGNIVFTVVNYSSEESNVTINIQNAIFEEEGKTWWYNVVNNVELDNSNNTSLTIFLKAWEAKVFVVNQTKTSVYPSAESITLKSTTGNYEISTNKGTLEFIASVMPENSMDEIQWRIEGDTLLAKFSDGILDACGCGEGEVTVIAHLKDNLDIEDRKTIQIRNQIAGQISNSTFDENVDDWGIWAPNCNNFFSWENGEAKVSYRNGSDECWSQLLGNYDMKVENGKTYKLSFDARASEDNLIFCVIREGGNDFEWISQEAQFNLTETMQHFSTEFSILKSSNIGQVQFTMGAGNIDFWFDNFSFCEIAESQVDTVQVTFQVDMQNETVSADGVFLNGSFCNWNPADAVQLQPSGTIYSATLQLKKGESVEYKYVNDAPDNWAQYEIIDGQPCAYGNDNNRQLTVPNNNTVLDLVCFNSCSSCQTNSTKDHFSDNEINITPNPTNGIIYLSGFIDRKISIQVLTINGVVMIEKTINRYDEKQIDVSILNSGIYFLNITDNTKVIKNLKFVKM